MKKTLSALLALALLVPAVPAASAAETAAITQQYAVFDNGSLKGRWEESYWAAPVVTDLEGDGKPDVVTAAYTVTAADAATGAVKWQTAKGPSRIYCTPVVADLDGDGKKEVAVGYGEGTVSAFNCMGQVLWSQKAGPNNEHVRSLAAADVDGDGRLEVIAGLGTAGPSSVYVYSCSGQPKPGCISTGMGSYCDGVWCNGITTGDLDSDGLPEIIVPTDNWFINAFNGDGSPVMANSGVFGGNVPWGAIGLYEDYDWEKNRPNGGWGTDPGVDSTGKRVRAGTYGPNNGQAVARYVDVDGDGRSEVVVTLTMVDRTDYFTASGRNWTTGSKNTRYMTVAIYNQDHTRFNKNGCNWEQIPIDQTAGLGGPLYYDPASFCCSVETVPVVADINGDGVNEILFNSLDGKVHCFSLKDSQHELAGWPFRLPKTTASLFELPGGVACADLNGDGRQEVVFGSVIKNGSGMVTGTGALYVVGSDGSLIASTGLHPGIEEGGVNTPNGTIAAVTVQDVDRDGRYEVLVNTRKYGLCCYEVTMKAGTARPAKPDQTAIPTNDRLTVDGRTVEPTAYKIDGANYFRLRDVAALLNDSPKQFNVGWDGAARSATIIPGQGYEKRADDLQGKPTANAVAKLSTDVIYLNGKKAELTIYKIGDNNYIKLRDLGNALGFQVGYDPATRTASITTK